MSNNDEAKPLEAGVKTEQGFSSAVVVKQAETAAAVLGAQVKAAVEARYIVAMQRPRDLMKARQRVLDACSRPGFAEKAIFKKPVGNDRVEGASIRLAEEFMRSLGNIATEQIVTYDDDEKRVIRVEATDLETNVTVPQVVVVAKEIERRKAQPGRKLLGTRRNTYGDEVYTYQATNDEIVDRVNALVSKALRTCIMRLVPADLVEDALECARATAGGAIKKDLPTARKRMVDAFASLNVTVDQLGEYLGGPIDKCSGDELADLRLIYNSIKEGECKWSDVMAKAAATAEPTISGKDAAGLAASLAAKQRRETPLSGGGAKTAEVVK